SLGTIDERLEPEQEQWHIVIVPIGTMSKRLLRINDQKCRSNSGHLMPSILRLAFMILAYVLPIERPKTVENGKEKNILFWEGRMVRWKVHRLWSQSGGQSQHGAQTVPRS